MILNLFSSASEHPLAEAKELRRIISELPADNPFKAVDEVVVWLESLAHAENFRADRVFEVVRQLDDAAQPFVRRLTRDYLMSPRLARQDERRFWSACLDFWGHLVTNYEASLASVAGKEKGADTLKGQLPLITARLLGAYGATLKWVHFKYGPVRSGFWRRLGQIYLIAERGKFAGKVLSIYPGPAGNSSPEQEMLRSLVLAASSLDSLLPIEVELAERLIAHFVPHFVLTAEDRPDNLYWIDLAEDRAPQRLARLPQATPTLRFISPAKAAAEVAEMLHVVEHGTVPADLALGGQYPPRLVRAVLRHIASYWAPTPPLRKHQRHPVKSKLFVLHGFETCAAVFGGAAAGVADQAESWIVDNVSLGGFGASLVPQRDDWLRIGALLCMQPEGGENWLLGVVRRYGRENDSLAGVGIQTIARAAEVAVMKPRGSLSYGADAGIAGLVFRDAADGDEIGVVLPANSYDMRESLDATIDGKFTLLVPVELVESGPDYEIARYRTRIAD